MRRWPRCSIVPMVSTYAQQPVRERAYDNRSVHPNRLNIWKSDGQFVRSIEMPEILKLCDCGHLRLARTVVK